MAKEVSIEEYKSEWLQQFEQEREKLRTTFEDKAVAIEHILFSLTSDLQLFVIFCKEALIVNLKSVFKGVVSSVLVFGLIAGTSTIPAFAESTEILSKDYAVESGSYSGTEFQAAYRLKKSNGAKVNFWIKNTGKVSVKITINGGQKRTLAPGKSGHISAPVGSLSNDYKFKAVPTPNGGEISISFRIAQKD